MYIFIYVIYILYIYLYICIYICSTILNIARKTLPLITKLTTLT